MEWPDFVVLHVQRLWFRGLHCNCNNLSAVEHSADTGCMMRSTICSCHPPPLLFGANSLRECPDQANLVWVVNATLPFCHVRSCELWVPAKLYCTGIKCCSMTIYLSSSVHRRNLMNIRFYSLYSFFKAASCHGESLKNIVGPV